MNRYSSVRARTRRLLVPVLVSALLVAVATPAHSAPGLNSRLAQARAIQAQVHGLDTQLEIVVERYNVAHAALAKTQGAVDQTKVDLSRTRVRLRGRQGALSRRVSGIYRNGDVTFVEVVLSSANFLDFVQQLDMLARIGLHDATIVSQIKTTKAKLIHDQKSLAVQLRARQAVASRVAADRADIDRRLAARQHMLAGVKREIAILQAQQAAEQARIARAAAARISRGGGGSSSSGGGGGGTYHPTGKSHSEVVRVAFAQLGKPYQWGASGPDSFDCSGLTMYCYGQIGISLSHSSAAQISEGQAVGRSELQPGDLVFFGSPIHHVGIYIGGGEYIHAPNTGDVVKISALDRSDYAGACRP